MAIVSDDASLARLVARGLPSGLTPMIVSTEASGALPVQISREGRPIVGYIHLRCLSSRTGTVETLLADADSTKRELFRFVADLKEMEDSLRASRGFVLVATRFGGPCPVHDQEASDFNPLAGGHAGVLKSVSQEWPEVSCRVVDVEPEVADEALAGILVDELETVDDFLEVVRGERTRNIVVLVPSRPHLGGHHVPPLREGDVVLVTGGGRGITAEVALSMAKQWRSTLVLVGRTALGGEEPRYRSIVDEVALKREVAQALTESGEPVDLPSISRTYASIVRRREVEENLRRMRETGIEVEYVVADVRDRIAFRGVIADVYGRHGRIDGVVHGAGVIEDRMIADKDQESFERVFSPKVDGALTLVEDLRLDELKFLCFFSSIAAMRGNAGQADYAAANEALNRLARWLAPRTSARVLSMCWGPWEPGRGMVSAALARRFTGQGIPLVTSIEGTRAFIDELAADAQPDVEVVFA